MFGKNHSEKTKTIMSEAKTGEKNPMYGKNNSDDSKTKMSDTANKSENSGRFKKGQARTEGAGRSSQAIEVNDIKNNITTYYDSIREAARALNIHFKIICNYIKNNQKKPYKGEYTFKKR